MQLGYNQGTTLGNSDTETDLKYAEKYGFDYFEFQMGPLYKYLESHSLEQLHDFFEDSDIRPLSLNVLEFFNLKTGDALNEILNEFGRMCEIAKVLGIEVIILVPSPNNKGLSHMEIKKDSVQIINRLTEISSKYNIRLAYEFLGFKQTSVNNFSQCYEIIQEVDRPDIGIVLDCFHFYAGGSDLNDLEAADVKKIFIFHINDSKKGGIWTLQDSDRLWPGEGEIPLAKILHILKAKCFEGVATVELFNPDYWEWDPEKTIKVAKEKTEKAINKYFV